MSKVKTQNSCKIIKNLFVVCCLLFVVSPSLAFDHVMPNPTINGPTGIIRVPSADVIPYKNFNLAVDGGVYFPPGGIQSTNAINYKMNLGTFHGVEMGIVGGTDELTQQMREGVFINMKLSLTTGEEPDPLLLAIGTENLSSKHKTDVYMVATKYLKQGPKVTFGFMADFPDNRFRPLGMAGVEFPLGETFFLATDGMIGESMSQLNAGFKLYFTPLFAINFYGLNVLDNINAKDSKSAFLGVSWANPF